MDHQTLTVRPESARYAEELRRSPGTASRAGHTGWSCSAGAAILAGATTPGPGALGTHHGVIYACPDHQAAAEARITAAGCTPEMEPAPPSHHQDPWPCGHITAYHTAAGEELLHPADRCPDCGAEVHVDRDTAPMSYQCHDCGRTGDPYADLWHDN